MRLKNKKTFVFLLIFVLVVVLFYTITNAENAYVDESKINNCKDESKKFSYNAFSVAEKLTRRDTSCTNRLMGEEATKTIFLTFDDGPSTDSTPAVLDILDRYGVKATFFVIAGQLEGNNQREILRKTYEKGHAVANHSYTHNIRKLFPKRNANLDIFIAEIKRSESQLKNTLGKNFSAKVVRVPGGSMSYNGMNKIRYWANKNNIALVDWNISGGDSDIRRKSSEKIFKNATNIGDVGTIVLLLHDSVAKNETIKALPKIIEHYKNNGYTFGILS